jgi:hypothetical protein
MPTTGEAWRWSVRAKALGSKSIRPMAYQVRVEAISAEEASTCRRGCGSARRRL